MKLSKKVMHKLEARYLNVQAAVRYDDEDMPFDAPMRQGDIWCARIDLDKQLVVDWKKGDALSFSMKVCDEGFYSLFDADNNFIDSIDGYVPNNILPGEFGDYLELDIDEDGRIVNWLDYANLSDFEVGDDD